MSGTSVVLPSKSSICLGRQYLFIKLRKQSEANKLAFNNLKTQIATVTNLYAKDYDSICDEIDSTYKAIREITKGVPVTEPLTEAFKIDYDVAAQMSDTEKQLLSKAYKKVASICHPDKGGTVEQFQQAAMAYQAGDYRDLEEMYLTHLMYPNLFWRQGAGIKYMLSEVDRPKTNLQVLRRQPAFRVVQHHIQGNKAAASALMQHILLTQLANLIAELNFLRKKAHHGI